MSKKKVLGLAAATAAVAAVVAKIRSRFRGKADVGGVPGAVPVTETIQDAASETTETG